jgi:hypothetical protein
MTATRSTSSDLCQYTFSDNRQCRMLRMETHPTLCPFHARDEQQILECPKLGTEIATSLTGDYLTAADLNHVLSKVFTALAQNRISQRTAATLGYLGQVMLHTLPLAKKEHAFNYPYESWCRMIDNATRLSDPPSTPQLPAEVAETAALDCAPVRQ